MLLSPTTWIFFAIMAAALGLYVYAAFKLYSSCRARIANASQEGAQRLGSIRMVAEQGRVTWHYTIINNLPSTFTGLGILGTFIGLVIGIQGLKIGGDASTLQSGLTSLISGISTSFWTSIGGVSLSILTSLISKQIFYKLEALLEIQRSRIDTAQEDDTRARTEQLLKLLAVEAKQQSVYLKQLMGLDEQGNPISLHDIQRVMSDELNGQLIKGNEALDDISLKLGTLASDVAASLGDVMQQSFGEPMRHIAESMDRMFKDQTAQHRGALEGVMEAFLEGLNSALGDRFEQLGESLDKTLSWHEATQETLTLSLEQLGAVQTQLQQTTTQQEAQLAKTQEALEAQMSIDQRRQQLMERGAQRADDLMTSFSQIAEQLSAQGEQWQEVVQGMGEVAATIDGGFTELAKQSETTTYQIDRMERALSEATSALTEQLKEATVQTADRVGAILNELDVRLEGFQDKMEFSREQYQRLVQELRAELHAGLAETFKQFDHETAEIADRLNGSYVNMQQSLEQFDVVMRESRELLTQQASLNKPGDTSRGTMQMPYVPGRTQGP